MSDLILRTADSGVRPRFEFVSEVDRVVAADDPDSGHFRTGRRDEYDARSWRLEWPDATLGEVLYLELLEEQAFGGTLPVRFLPLTAGATEVLVELGPLEVRREGLDRWRISLEVLEATRA